MHPAVIDGSVPSERDIRGVDGGDDDGNNDGGEEDTPPPPRAPIERASDEVFLSVCAEHNVEDPAAVVELKRGQILVPGFIDTHAHASQYPNAGLGLDMPLLKVCLPIYRAVKAGIRKGGGGGLLCSRGCLDPNRLSVTVDEARWVRIPLSSPSKHTHAQDRWTINDVGGEWLFNDAHSTPFASLAVAAQVHLSGGVALRRRDLRTRHVRTERPPPHPQRHHIDLLLCHHPHRRHRCAGRGEPWRGFGGWASVGTPVSDRFADLSLVLIIFGLVFFFFCSWQVCRDLGLRAYVGKVNMDRMSPNYYIEDSGESLAETERFIKGIINVRG